MERIQPGSTQDRGRELWGQRTGFYSQLRKIEQISGHNICESIWLSVFHVEIIQQRFVDIFLRSRLRDSQGRYHSKV